MPERTFYNPEQKIEMMNYVSEEFRKQYADDMGILLEKLRPYEEDYGDDACNFTTSYAKLCLAFIFTKSSLSNIKALSLIKTYVKLCVAHGRCKYGSESRWDIIKVEDIDKKYIVSLKLIKDPHSFQEKLDAVYKTLTANTQESEMSFFFKVMMYLIYLGARDEEVGLIKKSDYDKENKLIKLDKKIIQLDNYIVEYIDEIIDKTDVVMMVSSNLPSRKRLVNSEYLIRKTLVGRQSVTDNVTLNWVRFNCNRFNILYRTLTEESLCYTPRSIYDSGVFYRLYQMEKNGVKIDKSLLVEYYSDVTDRIIDGRMSEYEDWKETYYS